MDKKQYEKLLKQALILETQNRTEFLQSIEDDSIKQKLEKILTDETQVGDFLSAPEIAIEYSDIKSQEYKAGDLIKHFKIIELIAIGGMGCVYLAKDTKLKRKVALKTIRSEYLHFQTNKQRFRKEAEILSQINHSSICQIYDYIHQENNDILVLELVDGQTLNQVNFNHSQLLNIFIQIASALAFAHKNGIVHRDLKPDNIMFNSEGVVKILDFGIAKSEQINRQISNETDNFQETSHPELTKVGSLMGTLVYMSPEQAQGHKVESASDIYSLAVIMQELLTQKAVYHLDNTEDLRQQVINAELIDINSIPKTYKKLIKWMTQVRPEKRPNAHQLGQELQKIRDIPINHKNHKIFVLIISLLLMLISMLVWQKM